MLSIQPSNPQKCTPNLLPLRINHNGHINSTSRHWTPTTDASQKQHAHFRGRHLHGTRLDLPEGYTGAVLNVTDKLLPVQAREQTQQEDDDEEEDGEGMDVEVKVAEQIGEFDEVIVWGHGGEVDGSQDMYVRGVKEWVGWAESMHCDDEDGEDVEQSDGKGTEKTK